MISIWIVLHIPRLPIQDMDIPIPVNPTPELEITPDLPPQVPRIVVLQTIPHSSSVFITLPSKRTELEWITVQAVKESLHIRYNDFEKELNFGTPIFINYSEYNRTQLTIDLTIGE